MSDAVLILQQAPVGNPESALIAGMAAPTPNPQAMPDTSLSLGVATQEPNSWIYDFNPASGSARATFNGEVAFTSGGSATSGVTTWNGRTGAVVLTAGDVTAAGGAPIASPTFTGVPAAPTASPGTSTTQLATTAFVSQAIAGTALVASFNGRTGAVTLSGSDINTAGGALTASPALTGTPTAPTASPGTQSSQIATTQFVASALAGTVVSFNGRTGVVTLNLSDIQTAGGAPINAPAFTGVPTGPTATAGTATTQLATTAFVTNAVVAATGGVSSFNTRTGAVTLQTADVSAVGGALLAGPAFTGVPTAPTASAGVNTTQIATTAYVMTAIGAMAPVVASFNGRTGVVTLTTADITTAGGAVLASPVFTGTPAAPTPTAGDSSTRIATTAFVTAVDILKAPLASPTFTGTVTIPAGASIAGYLPTSGGTLTGDLAISKSNPTLALRKNASGEINAIVGTLGANARWQIGLGDATPEAGANSGSDFNIVKFADNGSILGNAPFAITRSTGRAIFTNDNPSTGTPTNPAPTLMLQSTASPISCWLQLIAQGQRIWTLGAEGANSGRFHIVDNTAGAIRIVIQPNGDCFNQTGTWNALSDVAAKRDIAPYTRGLADLVQLRPVSFNYNGALGSQDDGRRHVGLVAQEVEPHLPEVVGRIEAPGGGGEAATLDSGRLMFAVLNAIRELADKVERLEQRTSV